MADECPVHDSSKEDKNPIRNWTAGHSCYSLARKPASFCLCAENLGEAEFRSDGLTCWAGKISS